MEQRGEEVDEDTDTIRVDVCRSSQFPFKDVPSAIEGLRNMTYYGEIPRSRKRMYIPRERQGGSTTGRGTQQQAAAYIRDGRPHQKG